MHNVVIIKGHSLLLLHKLDTDFTCHLVAILFLCITLGMALPRIGGHHHETMDCCSQSDGIWYVVLDCLPFFVGNVVLC